MLRVCINVVPVNVMMQYIKGVFIACCVNYFSPSNDLRGLTAAPGNSISITFHCIVPKPMWLWDKDSCIHMRFAGKDLGKWKKNVGKFTDKR